MKKIHIDFSFFLFNAILFMFRDIELISGFYIACILHEAGHIAAIKLTGGRIEQIGLSCFGIKMSATPPDSLRNGIIVLMSGPAVNLITGGILFLAGNTGYTAFFSLAEGIFNLLPYSFLDGGAMLDMLAEGSRNESGIRIFYRILRSIIAILLLMILLFNI